MSVNRNNRCRGGGAISEGRHHHEGLPPQQCSVSAGYTPASGRPPSSGATIHETWGSEAFHTLREKGAGAVFTLLQVLYICRNSPIHRERVKVSLIQIGKRFWMQREMAHVKTG